MRDRLTIINCIYLTLLYLALDILCWQQAESIAFLAVQIKELVAVLVKDKPIESTIAIED